MIITDNDILWIKIFRNIIPFDINNNEPMNDDKNLYINYIEYDLEYVEVNNNYKLYNGNVL